MNRIRNVALLLYIILITGRPLESYGLGYVDASEGSRVVLLCDVDDSADVEYIIMEKDASRILMYDVSIAPKGRNLMLLENRVSGGVFFQFKGSLPSLTIENVLSGDRGVYDCKVNYAGGHPSTYTSWFLNVLRGRRQNLTTGPSEVTALVGNTVVLQCQLKNICGTVQWIKNGFALDRNNYMSKNNVYPHMEIDKSNKTSFNLVISNVSQNDEGIYKCQFASSGDCPAKRAAMKLRIMDRIKQTNHSSTVDIGHPKNGGESSPMINPMLILLLHNLFLFLFNYM